MANSGAKTSRSRCTSGIGRDRSVPRKKSFTTTHELPLLSPQAFSNRAMAALRFGIASVAFSKPAFLAFLGGSLAGAASFTWLVTSSRATRTLASSPGQESSSPWGGGVESVFHVIVGGRAELGDAVGHRTAMRQDEAVRRNQRAGVVADPQRAQPQGIEELVGDLEAVGFLSPVPSETG